MHLDAALVACPVDERLGESSSDARSACVATHIHASQHAESHRLTRRTRLCRISSDVADDSSVASSNQNHRVVIAEQPPEVRRSLSQRPCHVGVGIVNSGILGEEQRFEFDERFDVTMARDLHTRHVSTVAKDVNEQCPDFPSAGTQL